RVVRDGAGLERAIRRALDDRLDGVLELLLGARDDARGELRQADGLVDVDADAPLLLVADGLEDALPGEAGDLEEHVGALAHELLGDRPALRWVVEALRRIRVGLWVEALAVRLDALRAVLVAAPVVHDGRDVRAAHGADGAALGEAARHDAGEVAGLHL